MTSRRFTALVSGLLRYEDSAFRLALAQESHDDVPVNMHEIDAGQFTAWLIAQRERLEAEAAATPTPNPTDEELP